MCKQKTVQIVLSFFCKHKFIIVFSFAFLLYSNTITHFYAYDDATVITDNKDILQGAKAIPIILTSPYRHGWDENSAGHYRPLPLVTYALEFEYFGKNPVVSHFNNVFLYAITAILLLLTLTKIFRNVSTYIPYLTTLLFIAHPVHTEVVANIKSRDEIMGFLFGMLALYFLFKHIDSKKYIYEFLGSISFFLALTSKESIITLLVIFPLSLYYFRNLNVISSIKKTIPYAIAASLFILLEFLFVKTLEMDAITVYANSIVAAESLNERWATTLYTLGKYVQLLFLPFPLVHDYSYEQIPIVNFLHPIPIISLLYYTVIIFYPIKNFKKNKIISFGIIFYLVTLIIVSNIFFLIGSTMAERFLFTPSLGFCLIITFIIVKKCGLNQSEKNTKYSPRKFILICSVVLGFYSLKTYIRNFDWKDNYTLFSKDINYGKQNARILYSMGTSLIYLGNEQKGIVKRDSIYNLGIYYFKKSIEKYSKNDNAYYNIGIALTKMKKYEEAIRYFEESLKINSYHKESQMNLGNCYGELKDFEKAISSFLKVISYAPDYPMVYNNLGDVYNRTGEKKLAIFYFKKTITLDSTNVHGHYNLGVECFHKRNYKQSLMHLLKVHKYSKSEKFAHDNFDLFNKLSILYDELGNKSKKEENEILAKKYSSQ